MQKNDAAALLLLECMRRRSVLLNSSFLHSNTFISSMYVEKSPKFASKLFLSKHQWEASMYLSCTIWKAADPSGP